jgi:FG-GAP-like repeat/Bacterial Ig domain
MLRFGSVSTLFVGMVLCCSGGSAQTAPFTVHSYAAGSVPRDLYAIDVNNDGVPDMVENIGGSLAVMIANGSGGFSAPSTIYTFPTTYQGTEPLAAGDFNGDGKVDLICAMAGTNQLAVFLGNGNGTFQAPKYETVALPSGQYFGGGGVVAADFNHDGKLDLVTEGNTTSTQALYLMEGDGTGNFAAPKTIYTFAANTGMGDLRIGDFDGDGNADLAMGVSSNCTQGGCAQMDLYVLYGNGAGVFSSYHVYTAAYTLSLSTGDVNSDGRTDIFGYTGAGANQLLVLTSQPDRQFTTFTMPTNYTMQDAGFGTAPTMVLANFDGDSKYNMDIAGLGYNSSGQEAFVAFIANGSGGYEESTTDLPYAASTSNIVVGDFNEDLEPDVATILNNSTTTPTLEVGLNNSKEPLQNWGGCPYPTTGQGFWICEPQQNMQTSVSFNAAANSFGMLRKIEVWVDGRKIGEQYHVWENRGWLDLTATLATGSHKATFFATDVDGRQQKTVVTFQVAAGCSAPGSAGVNLCSPASGSTVGSPVQVLASATVTGTLSSMQLWVEGVKKYSESSSTTLQTSISLAAGTHRFAVLAVNTAGQKWEQAADATVK